MNFSQNNNFIGMIIPLSGVSIDGFKALEKLINKQGTTWHSFYSGDRNPSELFTGVKIRANIFITKSNKENVRFISKYQKWYSIERDLLFSKISYVKYKESTENSPKMHSELEKSIYKKISNLQKTLGSQLYGNNTFYYHAAPISWSKGLLSVNDLIKKKLNIADSYKEIGVSEDYKYFAFLLSNSSLFFVFWLWMSDCYNLTKKYFEEFKIPDLRKNDITNIRLLSNKVQKELIDKMEIVEYTYKNKGSVIFAQFYPSKSKPIIDEIDKVLAQHYGFTDEELDFIINYDIKYRMGKELEGEE